jgi:hypothetical protein
MFRLLSDRIFGSNGRGGSEVIESALRLPDFAC